jgi:hypothetical protein
VAQARVLDRKQQTGVLLLLADHELQHELHLKRCKASSEKSAESRSQIEAAIHHRVGGLRQRRRAAILVLLEPVVIGFAAKGFAGKRDVNVVENPEGVPLLLRNLRRGDWSSRRGLPV